MSDVVKLSGLLFIFLLSACDQTSLPWNETPAIKLTEEQIRARIDLQQELVGLQTQLEQFQSTIDESQARLKLIRSKHGDKFIADQVQYGGKQFLGESQASVAIVEFTDYQCPYCARHVAEVMPLLKRYYIDKGKLRYHVRDFPLAIHSQAKYAAVVASCAGEQGRYWQMHDVLFKNQKRLNSRLYLGLSRQLGLDPEKLSDCLIDSDSIKNVNADTFYGQSLGVGSTPKFFVGLVEGDKISQVIMIKGAQPYGYFSEVIDLLIDMDLATKAMQSSYLRKVTLKGEISRVEGDLSAYK